MKTELTKEESTELRDFILSFQPDNEIVKKDILTITDLMEIIPKEILHNKSFYTLIIEWSPTSTLIYYRNILGQQTQHKLESEFINALKSMIHWLGKDYLNQNNEN